MEIWARVAAGGIVGAILGYLLGRARVCSGPHCHARASTVATILGGAIFGAAMGYFLAVRP